MGLGSRVSLDGKRAKRKNCGTLRSIFKSMRGFTEWRSKRELYKNKAEKERQKKRNQ